jgi:hypothetical protein
MTRRGKRLAIVAALATIFAPEIGSAVLRQSEAGRAPGAASVSPSPSIPAPTESVKTTLILWAVAIVLLVAGGAVVGYFNHSPMWCDLAGRC